MNETPMARVQDPTWTKEIELPDGKTGLLQGREYFNGLRCVFIRVVDLAVVPWVDGNWWKEAAHASKGRADLEDWDVLEKIVTDSYKEDNQ
jgi:hypothetical protein